MRAGSPMPHDHIVTKVADATSSSRALWGAPKLMDRILSWAGHAVLLAALLLTRTLLGAEEVNLLLLGDWGAGPTKSEHVKAQQRTAKVLHALGSGST